MPAISFDRIKQSLLDWSDVPLRLILCATFVVHGYSKLYGGVDSFAQFLQSMNVPLPILTAWLVTFVELFGGLFLLFGLFTRFTALAIGINMLMAIILVHLPQGFMMKAGEGRSPAGYEWQLALLAMCVTLMMRGSGSISIDHMLRSRRKARNQAARQAAAPQERAGTATSVSTSQPADVKLPPASPQPRVPPK